MPARRGAGGADRARVGGSCALSEPLPSTVVAQRLGISKVAVRRHISSAMHKLDVTNRACAVPLVRDESATGWPKGGRDEGGRRAATPADVLCTLALALAAS
jgi:Bacterial regulatory proteins, luxR family